MGRNMRSQVFSPQPLKLLLFAAALLPCLVIPKDSAAGPNPAGKGSIQVTADREGMQIVIDGYETGQLTPALLKGIVPGRHLIELRDGCLYGRAELDLKPGLTARLSVTTGVGRGSLRVETTPVPALVFLDDVEKGQSPYQSAEVDCGEHTLRFQAQGFYPAVRSVVVPLREEAALSVRLDAELFGALRLNTTPPQVEVWVDGVRRDMVEGLVSKLPIGPHHVELRKEGFLSRSFEIDVLPDLVIDKLVSLDPLLTTANGPGAGPLPGHAPIPETPPPHPDRGGETQRLVLNSLTLVGGVVLGTLSYRGYRQTLPLYDQFLAIEKKEQAYAFYEESIRAKRDLFEVEAVGSALLLGTSAFLWVTTPKSLSLGPGWASWQVDF